jgi:hypothetical protein
LFYISRDLCAFLLLHFSNRKLSDMSSPSLAASASESGGGKR